MHASRVAACLNSEKYSICHSLFEFFHQQIMEACQQKLESVGVAAFIKRKTTFKVVVGI